MTRPARNRLLVLCAWAVCLAALLKLPSLLVGLGVGVAVVAFGYSQWVTREFFAGRRAMGRHAWVRAINSFEHFEKTVTDRPTRWALLAASVYSFDVVAIARNNVGVIHLKNEQLDRAEAALRAAVERDPGYAVPHVNLAVVAAKRGDRAAVDAELERARQLGVSSRRTHARVRALL